MKEWLDNNNILLYSTHDEENSVITERFIKTLKAKSILKNDNYLQQTLS